MKIETIMIAMGGVVTEGGLILYDPYLRGNLEWELYRMADDRRTSC
jgi:hypothetical protein